jgi:hypothetical protein
MGHEKVTVSLPVDVAVIVETLKPPEGADVDWVTPPEKVAVNESGYFKMIIPDPPFPPLPFKPD